MGVPDERAFDVKAAAARAVAGNWRLRGKCAGADPQAYETANLTPGREEEEARELCDGCQVFTQCAADAVQPVNMAELLGTFEADDWVNVSGVVRAGVPT
ncbi:WhiB family transcriptional regulator [Nocardiaceae bacterium NPDC056970]